MTTIRAPSPSGAPTLTALAAGTELACACGQPDCTGAQSEDAPAKTAVVYVIAEQDSVQAAGRESDPSGVTDDPAAAKPAQSAAPPAFVFGGGVLPTPLLGAILDRAGIREVCHPGDGPPEPRYRPTPTLDRFVRCRDLTCRFPGCDKPAQFCDLDHTVAYPTGPTHASNLKCLCRFHHLLKTFWNGVAGWRDRQLPDGTVVWTSPTGHTYTTYPGSKQLFPTLCESTGTLPLGEPPTPETHRDRGVMMPKRRNTRAHNSARAIAAERRLNETYRATVSELVPPDRSRRTPAPRSNDPPPF